MLLHSRQKRKVICSWVFEGPFSPVAEVVEGAYEDIVSRLYSVEYFRMLLK